MGKGPPWIPMALSTLSPTTSPHLSSLQLTFIGSPSHIPSEYSIEGMGSHIQRIADQVTRIKREFNGAVNSTVIRDPRFEAMLKTRYSM